MFNHSFSLKLWLRPQISTGDDGTVFTINKANFEGDNLFAIALSGRIPQITFDAAGTYPAGAILPNNDWTFLLVTLSYDNDSQNTSVRLYINTIERLF
jgi:hypothetical protein